jgi:hypothetical protein
MAIKCIEIAKVHITLPGGKIFNQLLPVVSETVRTERTSSVVVPDLLIWTAFGEYLSSGQPALWALWHCTHTDSFRQTIASSDLHKYGIVLPDIAAEETGADTIRNSLNKMQNELLFLKKQQEVIQKLLS